MLKWAKTEENLAVQDVFSKVFEVSSMWSTLWKDFGKEVYWLTASFVFKMVPSENVTKLGLIPSPQFSSEKMT